MAALDTNASLVDPHIVGNVFVQKYYNHLYESPAEVHKFYLEDSVLGRPGSDGEMVSVKSLKAINEQIISFDYENSKIQILTADSQASYKNGVVTLVTGLLTVKDDKRMKFSQSFFLVPHKGSFFVLNDVFRYVSDEIVEPETNNKEVEEAIPQVAESAVVHQVTESTVATVEPTKEVAEPVTVPSQQVTLKQTTEVNGKKPGKVVVANGHTKPREEKVVANGQTKPQDEKIVANGQTKPQEEKVVANVHTEPQDEKVVNGISNGVVDAPKKSFASIVQSLAQNGATFTGKASPAKAKPVAKTNVVSESKAPLPVTAAGPIAQPADRGSIFVANLPMEATPDQLNEAFKGFGVIVKDGIQVRSYRMKNNCIGFVTFESVESVKLVLQAHREVAIKIGNRRLSIEEKYANGENGRGSMRNGGNRSENGYRNDGFRPRGNGFNGGRGGGRNGYERRGEGRNGEVANGEGKVHQNIVVKAVRENVQSKV